VLLFRTFRHNTWKKLNPKLARETHAWHAGYSKGYSGATVPQSSLPHCTKGLNLGPRSLAESHFLHFPISTNPATQSIVAMLSRFQKCRVGQNHSFIATNKRMDLRLLYLKPALVLVLISEKKKNQYQV
jgi:hypothetical protein